MAGGILQLLIKGPQDIFITENPELSFFKTVFKKHSAFSIETKEQFFNSICFGTKSICQIAKDGDLISNISVRITLPSLNLKKKENCDIIFGYANSIGHLMIEYVELEIGGYIIDKRFGEWFEIWSEISQTAEKKPGYAEMIGKRDPISFKPDSLANGLDLIVPLDFYFTKNIGLALPIIALYKNDVYVNIKWRNFNDCWICNKPNIRLDCIPRFSAVLYVDYVYLELCEREDFIKNSHLYLAEQVQYNNIYSYQKSNLTPSIELNFSHPVKEIVWVIQRSDINSRSSTGDTDFTYGNDWFNYSCFKSRNRNIVKDPFDVANLMFNGQERSMAFPAIYYRLYQTYFRHTKTPSNYIYVNSFALQPEEFQPTGHCNFSGIEKAKLNLKMISSIGYDYNVKVYALSYNFIIIIDGQIGMGFQM
jgi:hypothetical protein